MSTRRRRKVRLAAARMLSPSVRSLVFRFEDGEPFAFEAGQYVDVFAPTRSGMVFKRSYSIASAPEPESAGAREIEIAVTLVAGGPLSTALHALAIGAPAEVEGPAGVFTRRDGPHDPLLFVATGTGLAPLRSMLASEVRSAARGKSETSARPIALLFGCRTEADVLWVDELRGWAASNAVRLELTLSRPSPAWRASGARTGYVQAHVAELARALDASTRAHAYVCGLSRMVDDVVRMLETDLGFARERLHYEIYD
jgi:CDP-4-dehydro-6-deoxyglucose reductase